MLPTCLHALRRRLERVDLRGLQPLPPRSREMKRERAPRARRSSVACGAPRVGDRGVDLRAALGERRAQARRAATARRAVTATTCRLWSATRSGRRAASRLRRATARRARRRAVDVTLLVEHAQIVAEFVAARRVERAARRRELLREQRCCAARAAPLVPRATRAASARCADACRGHRGRAARGACARPSVRAPAGAANFRAAAAAGRRDAGEDERRSEHLRAVAADRVLRPRTRAGP